MSDGKKSLASSEYSVLVRIPILLKIDTLDLAMLI